MIEESTRVEHIAWCKQRAIEIANTGDIPQALALMASDLMRHPETSNHIGIRLGTLELLAGTIRTKEDMINFIEGFN